MRKNKNREKIGKKAEGRIRRNRIKQNGDKIGTKQKGTVSSFSSVLFVV